MNNDLDQLFCDASTVPEYVRRSSERRTASHPNPGAAINTFHALLDVANAHSITVRNVSRDAVESPTLEGWTDFRTHPFFPAEARRITLLDDASLEAQIITFLHELSHAFTRNIEQFDRLATEVIAESAAYVLARRLGFEDLGYSARYVANWTDGRLEEARRLAPQINDVVARIEAALSRTLPVAA